jgi:hypothetical protein
MRGEGLIAAALGLKLGPMLVASPEQRRARPAIVEHDACAHEGAALEGAQRV